MRWIINLLLLVCFAGIASAQEVTTPLYFVRDGYIFSWSDADGVRQLTTEDFASDLVLSPDGKTFAFIQQSREFPSAGGFEVEDPLQTSHICLWNAGDPECITEEENIVILRRFLQWHMDKQLTWIEYPGRSGDDLTGPVLVRYDPETGDSHLVRSLPMMVADAGMFGFIGYEKFRDQIYVACCPGAPSIRLYNAQTGEQEFQTYVPESLSPDVRFIAVIPAHSPTQDEMFVLYCDAQWRQFDLENSVWDNAITEAPEYDPYFGLLSNPPDALHLRLSMHSCDYAVENRAEWQIVAADGSVRDTLSFPYFFGTQWQIAPDGQEVAYLTDEGIHIWQDGEIHLIEDTEGTTEFLWSAVGWQAFTNP